MYEVNLLIFKAARLLELAPYLKQAGCRDIVGPIPPSLWIRIQI